LAALALAICLSAFIWLFLPGDDPAKLTLTVFVATVIAWIMTPLDRTAVALVAALSLVIGGADTPQNFYSSLGNPLIWLLVGAFVIARALSEIRLAERLAATALKSARSVSGLFYALTFVIGATAFVIPSTTGRAALLLPVFMTLSASIGDRQIARALSIHVPTVILLSACGSLIGAGAHLVAVDMMREIGREPGAARQPVSFLEWTRLGLPYALASSILSTFVILRLFLDREQRATPLTGLDRPAPPPLSARERCILALVAMTVTLWLTQSLHGIEITIITIAAAIAVTAISASGSRLKDSLRSVDWNLLLFIAGATLIGEALIDNNAAGGLFDALASFSKDSAAHPVLVAGFVALVALLGHLVITSRTARATALIPLLALPFSQFGYNGAALIFLVAIATGYCLTLTISAKSLLIYSEAAETVFSHGDLLRLSAILLPLHLILAVAFATVIWPFLGLPFHAPQSGPGAG
jgi:anion transporter